MTAKRKFRRGKYLQDLPHAYCSLMPLMAAGLLSTSVVYARPPVNMPLQYETPRPRTDFVFSGSVQGGQPVLSGANSEVMTIRQSTQTLGLNWDKFNIGREATVNFIQPNASSRVLNRIWDNDPSVIRGKLNANGQVYLLNQNGILFGEGAQVNVGGLLASSLNIADSALLNKGLPDAKGERQQFVWEGDASNFATKSFVALDAGATITTSNGGKVVLLAPASVENLGLIETRGDKAGEAILAAGGKVVLTAPDDPELRGLLVETTPVVKDGITYNSAVTNQGSGSAGGIGGGVVTLAAMAVNQEGRVSASRAVNLNGEIMLVSGKNEAATVNLNLSNAEAKIDWTSNHSGGKQTVNVVQSGATQEIDWSSGFKVDAGQTFAFQQPKAGSVVYNYIYDPDHFSSSAGRSVIDGGLSANGQLYLINEKGISFTANARVSAANFVASALGINPTVVASGLLNQSRADKRAFYLNKDQLVVADAADLPAARTAALAQFNAATISVAKGASIKTGDNGIAMLLGGKVNQGGTISTPGGQTVLAAGADIYLKPPSSQSFRGYVAEVNPLYAVQGWNGNQWLALSRGADANRVVNTGSISSSFGDISLVGHEIVQNGTLTASTSLNRNGSIHLHARDMLTTTGLTTANDGEPPTNEGNLGNVGGKLTFAAGSRTEVKLDPLDGREGKYGADGRFYKVDAKGDFLLDKNKAPIAWDEITLNASQKFAPSTIDAAAASIVVEGKSGSEQGAQLIAHSGKIRALSTDQFSDELNVFSSNYDAAAFAAGQGSLPDANASIFVGSGAKLDVSGVTARKSVVDLFIDVELRGDEFANNPLQRTGVLRGETFTVDIRDKVAIADLSGYIGKVGQNLDERTASGGDISLRSSGSVIVKKDAVLDVSGGKVVYSGARVSETRIHDNSGFLVRLNDAASDFAAAGIYDVERQELGYTEGRNAGSVELSAHSLAVDGTLKADTVRGEYQRNVGDPATDRTAIPLGGKLIVQDAGQHYTPAGGSAAQQDAAYGKAQIVFVKGASTAASGLDAGDQAGPRLELSDTLLKNGFSRFDIRSDGRVELADNMALNLAPGGEFSLSGRQVHIGGDITAAGGSIDIRSRDPGLDVLPAKYFSLTVGKNARLSTAGNWVNDYLTANPVDYALSALDGGSITLASADDLSVARGAVIDVSGGARVKSDGSLDAGDGGSISLASGRLGGIDIERDTASIFLNGELRGYSLAQGGSLSVTSSRIVIDDKPRDNGGGLSRQQRYDSGKHGAVFNSAFFNQGGFYEFTLIASGDKGLVPVPGMSGMLDVANGTRIRPNPYNWFLSNSSAYQLQASGSSIADFAERVRLAPDLRAAPTHIALQSDRDMTIGKNTVIGVDTGGSIDLETYSGQLTVLGTLEARAGRIALSRSAGSAGELEYTDSLQSKAIYLGEDSKLITRGTTRLDATTLAMLESGNSAGSLRELGLYRGEVLAGGTVDIQAGNGYLISRDGSEIDVRGSSDTLNTPHAASGIISYASRNLGSAGGKIALAAGAGMLLDGGYQAEGGGDATDGVFSLRFDRSAYPWVINPASPPPAAVTGDRELQLYESSGAHANLWPGTLNLDAATYNGKARLDLTLLEKGGFGSVYLQSENRMRFDGKIDFAVANQLRLDSPNFHAGSNASDVKLSAAAIQIGNYGKVQTPAVQTPNSQGYTQTRFNTVARDLALVGNFSWNGFASSRFASRGELHFDSQGNSVDRNGQSRQISVPNGQGGFETIDNPDFNGRLFNGGLRGTGAVEFAAGRLSPAIFSDFVVDLSTDPNGSIRISHIANPDTLGPLISAGGRLAFRADTIVHDGRIEAPLGVVEFVAPNGSVTLTGRSQTSVAASAVMPYGHTTQSGKNWEFLSALWDATTGGVSSVSHAVTVPIKSVLVDADKSNVASGAKIDLSGGGDAVAWEFTPGPGGKNDILTPTVGSEPTIFAILPGWNGNFAPADSHNLAYYNVSNPQATENGYRYDAIPSLKPGDQIDLGDNPTGLSGKYTLLPAKYALLKGAVLVTIKPGNENALVQAQAQTDGSWLVSGNRVAANADGSYSSYSSTPLTVELAPQDVVLARAKYTTTSATDKYYDNSDQLPGDAGKLAIIGRSQLTLDPVIRGGYEQKITHSDGRSRSGFGAQLDLAAPNIEVVNGGSAGSGAGWVTLDKDALNKLDIASLLLGGVRSAGESSTAIDVVADKVKIATSGDEALSAGEIILTGKDQVLIGQGSQVQASGVGAGAAARSYTLAGDAGFVRIGSGAQASLTRSGTVNRSRGDVVLEQGAGISGRALYLDASRENVLNGSMRLNNAGQAASAGGAISIGAGRINVVADGSMPADGLNLSNQSLAAFDQADQIRLVSYTTLDLYGNAQLGNAGVKELVLSASGIAGHGGNATIAADKVRLENPNSGTSSFVAGSALGSGTLNVNADTVELAGNADAGMRDSRTAGFAMRGFNTVNVSADKELRFTGRGVTAIDNDAAFGGSGVQTQLNVNAGRVVAGAGADHAIVSSGKTNISGGGNTSKMSDLGGKLDWRADALDIAGRIVAPAGSINLQATGIAGDVIVRNGAFIGAEGATVKFGDAKAYAPGGTVVIRSDKGDIDVRSGAVVSVAGGEGADGGQLALLAESGELEVDGGTLRGNAGEGKDLLHGELIADANSLDINQIAEAVRDSKGTFHFRGGMNIRQRSGDMLLDKTLKSDRVTLSADAGGITVGSNGEIDASGSKGGEIAFYAGADHNITLQGGSLLKAAATEKVDTLANAGTRGQGGTVLLATGGTGTIISESGSEIDVSAADGSLAQGGKVVFRVEREDVEQQLRTLTNALVNPTVTTLSVLTGGGSGNAITLNPSPAMSSYNAGMVASFTVPANSSGAVTLNINGKGAKALVNADGTPFSATNRLSSGQVIVAVYDGSRFVVSANGLQDTGTSSIYRVAYTTKPAALQTGMQVTFKAKTANVAAPTLVLNNDNNLRASLVDQDGNPLAANAFAANQLVTAIFDGSSFRVVKDLSLAATSNVTASSLRAAPTLNGDITGARTVNLEAVRVINKTTYGTTHVVNTTAMSQQSAQAEALLAASGLAATLDPAARLGLTVTPGLELRSPGDLLVGQDWNLNTGSAGYLSLRAEGNLLVNGNISSGFGAVNTTINAMNPNARLASTGESWSYRFVAGADLGAAALLATRDGTDLLSDPAGDLVLGAGRYVRTGTGDIDLAARRDIRFESNAAMYTAGVQDTTPPANFSGPVNDFTVSSKQNYSAIGGGDIRVEAGRDVSMATQNAISDWLVRIGDASTADTQWWGRMSSFRNGLATFGGGDIRVRAAGNLDNLTLATPTSGRVPRLNGVHQAALAEINGGGDVQARAGGNVNGGVFYAETGRLDVAAANAVENEVKLSAGDAAVRVSAGTGVSVGNISNPLGSLPGSVYGSDGSLINALSGASYKARFSTYGENSRVGIVSVNGAVAVKTAGAAELGLAPAEVSVAALQGDINVATLEQMPGSAGQLDLFAAGNINLSGRIIQHDIAPEALFSLANPRYFTPGVDDPYATSVPGIRYARTPWHATDTQRSRMIARDGDISGNDNPGALNSLFNEAVQIEAGGDIRDLGITAQHARNSDVSTITAGGDIVFTTNAAVLNASSQDLSFKVNGPGRIEVIAGGNIDLGNRGGIQTRGNLENPFLPEQGADVFAMAGSTGPDYDGFVAWAEKNLKLSSAEKASLGDPAAVRELFYATLRDAGRAAAQSGSKAEKDKNYAIGRAAISALFPKGTVGKGNIDFFYSQIKTEQGGDIDLLVPGGGLTVGIANPSADLLKSASEQGLFTIRGGAIRAMVRDDFLVNQSRVFTLDGGDILVWSDKGNIDAGSGAKTVISTPPPTLVIRNGQIVLDTSNSVSGSGIGTLLSRPTTPPSDLDLFAPDGTIDAGDAGLRSSGNVTLGATQVLNAANIAASGVITGPPPPAPAVVIPAAPPNPATNAMANDAAGNDATAAGRNKQGLLTVEVLDAGGDDSAPAATPTAGGREKAKDEKKDQG